MNYNWSLIYIYKYCPILIKLVKNLYEFDGKTYFNNFFILLALYEFKNLFFNVKQ